MTVINTSYCSIEEAWGDMTTPPPSKRKDVQQKKKRMQPQDPICELYENKVKNQSYGSETDLVRFANEYSDKSRFQRSMRPLPNTSGYVKDEIEYNPKAVAIVPDRSKYDVSDQNKGPKQPNVSLFEKQFEMKLPPLYDGGDCPSFITQEETHEDIQYLLPRKHNTTSEEGFFNPNFDEYPNFKTNVYQEDDDVEDEFSQYVNEESTQVQQQVRPQYRTRPPSQQTPQTFQESTNQPRPRSSNKTIEPWEESKRQHVFKEIDDEDYDFPTMYKKKSQSPELKYLDLILYIISGIILIFLLEQFVRIGINMQL